jgi:hypothetical protein
VGIARGCNQLVARAVSHSDGGKWRQARQVLELCRLADRPEGRDALAAHPSALPLLVAVVDTTTAPAANAADAADPAADAAEADPDSATAGPAAAGPAAAGLEATAAIVDPVAGADTAGAAAGAPVPIGDATPASVIDGIRREQEFASSRPATAESAVAAAAASALAAPAASAWLGGGGAPAAAADGRCAALCAMALEGLACDPRFGGRGKCPPPARGCAAHMRERATQ